MRVPGIQTFGGFGRAALAIFVFGFLAFTAGTGGLTSAGNVRERHLAWLVEKVLVASLGRTGAVATFLLLGVCAAAIAYKWDRLTEMRR